VLRAARPDGRADLVIIELRDTVDELDSSVAAGTGARPASRAAAAIDADAPVDPLDSIVEAHFRAGRFTDATNRTGRSAL
jgi:hypothetical protein